MGSQRLSCALPIVYSQWIYLFGFLCTAIVTWVLRDYGASVLDFPPLDSCLGASNSTYVDQNATCLGEVAVLRIAWGNVLFFAIQAVLLLGVTTADSPRIVLHTGFWWLK